MTDYYKVHNSDRDVIARVEDREIAHKVAELADMYYEDGSGPHSVQEP